MAKEEQFDIVRYIRGSNAIEGIYEEKEIEQSLRAWEYLQAQSGELSHKIICDVQKIITMNQTNLREDQRGFYRNISETNVSVGGRHAPDHSLVEGLMIKWLEDTPRMQPLIGHIRFEGIHPFVDGNGRTGRMIYWYIALNRGSTPKYYGTDRDPTLSEQQNREWYYRLFDNAKMVQLSNNNWGMNVPKFEARVKGTDGNVYSGYYHQRPTDAEIEEGLPKGVKIMGKAMIRETK